MTKEDINAQANADATITALKEKIKWMEETLISSIKLDPGDVVVCFVPGAISQFTADQLREVLEAHFLSHKVIVLGDSMRLGVIKGQEEI